MSDIDYAGRVLDGFNAGRQHRDARERRNALTAYAQSGDEASLAPLIGQGDFATLSAAREHRQGGERERVRREAGSMAAGGDYAGATRTAIQSGDLDMAQALQRLDRGQLEAAQEIGQRGAAVVLSTLNIRGNTPQETAQLRFDYIAQNHHDLAAQLNVTPEQLQAMDLSDDNMLRATADSWRNLSDLAGTISTRRFGDSYQTVRTGPSGTSVIDTQEIPETRAEALARQREGRVAANTGRRSGGGSGGGGSARPAAPSSPSRRPWERF